MKFDNFEHWRKNCAEHMGPIKKSPTGPEGQKTVFGSTMHHNSENKKKSHMGRMSGLPLKTALAAGQLGIGETERIE